MLAIEKMRFRGALLAGLGFLATAAAGAPAPPGKPALPAAPAPGPSSPAADPGAATGPQPGDRAPELPPLEAWIGARPTSLADLRGRIVILEFFSPRLYATTYRGSLERLHDLRESFEARGAVFLAIAPELACTLEDFARDRGVSFPLLADPAREAMEAFGVRRLGRSFVIDRDGIVRWTGFADLGRERWLREIEAIGKEETRGTGGRKAAGRDGSNPPADGAAKPHPAAMRERAAKSPPAKASSRSHSRRSANPLTRLPLERSWERARRRSMETGATILAIVTAGEDPADRALDRTLYRSSTIRRLAAKHVLLVACPDSHEEEIVTEGGVTRRVCTRFGSGSCREHQQVARDLEARLVRERDGSALSPQHLVLDAEGTRLDAASGAISTSRLQSFLRRAARARPRGALVAMEAGRS